MSQQIDNDHFENNSSDLETQDSALTSENKSRETESHTILEAEVMEKKSFTEKWETNRFWLVRGSYFVLRTVWMTVMIIGGFIAWLIAMLFI